eukprot:9314317-Alexandrium_andersonii.AAC.1
MLQAVAALAVRFWVHLGRWPIFRKALSLVSPRRGSATSAFGILGGARWRTFGHSAGLRWCSEFAMDNFT